MEAFANWNRNRQAANMSKPLFVQRLERGARGGGVSASCSGWPQARPKWISVGRIRVKAISNGTRRAAEARNMA
jgi:hypothetical protein